MAKRRTTEDLLAQLRTLRSGDGGAQAVRSLGELLAHSNLHGIVLKGAAALADRFTAKDLAPQLAAQIQSLMSPEGPKRDPGCEGKIAALQTLINWDADLPNLFLQAAAYHQSEPTFGGSFDSAGQLRALAAVGLASSRPPNALDLLIDLLVDPEKSARAGAANALGRWRGIEAVPLLRLKARTGDADAEVLGETLASLLQQDPTSQSDFVAQFLTSKTPGIVEAAALALGQAKPENALQKLTAAYPAHRGSPVATTLLMAIGLLRSEEAITWLITRLTDSRPREGLNIIDALAHFHRDPKIVARIQLAVQGNPELEEAFQQSFPR